MMTVVRCKSCKLTRAVTRRTYLRIRCGERSGRCLRCAATKWKRKGKGERVYTPPPPCRHCKTSPAYRARGLCNSCYVTPAVRDLYPRGSANPATAKHVHDAPPTGGRLPPEPTTARPGSEEKKAVMARRIAAGYDPHHPGDSRASGSWRDAAWELGHGGTVEDAEDAA